MKVLVNLCLLICMVAAETQKLQADKTKTLSANSITTIPKQEQYYQPVQYQQVQIQPQNQAQLYKIQPQVQIQAQPQVQQVQSQAQGVVAAQPQYVQIVQKPVYVPQQQPAMIIIAQPAYVPANLVYGGATQQLLNYFHANPQARYQLLHGNYPPQQQPQVKLIPQPVMHQALVAQVPQASNYQVVSPSQYQLNSLPPPEIYTQQAQAQIQSSQSTPQYHSLPTQPAPAVQQQQAPKAMQLTELAQLAQMAAQQYLTSPTKTAPAIITGFENFTPEQQVQIKSQLNAHFGQINEVSSSQYNQLAGPTKSQYSNQYSSRYVAQQPSNQSEFVPSQQIKSESSAISAEGSAESIKKYSKI